MERTLSNVVFPAPEGPTMETTSPAVRKRPRPARLGGLRGFCECRLPSSMCESYVRRLTSRRRYGHNRTTHAMNLHEFQGKSILKQFGVSIQEGRVASTSRRGPRCGCKASRGDWNRMVCGQSADPCGWPRKGHGDGNRQPRSGACQRDLST